MPHEVVAQFDTVVNKRVAHRDRDVRQVLRHEVGGDRPSKHLIQRHARDRREPEPPELALGRDVVLAQVTRPLVLVK